MINGSLKTDRETREWRTYIVDLLKVREGKRGKEQVQRSEQQVSEDRRGDRVWRIYTRTDMRKTSLKADGETESGEPT